MNLVKKHNRFYQVLGVGAALLVPALAVGLEIPNSFTAGTPIRAADINENFKTLADEVTALREEVDTLRGKLEPGTRSVLGRLDATNTAAIYEAKSAGLFQLVPSGSNYANIDTRVIVGAEVANDDWSLQCGSNSCPTVARLHNGNSVAALVGPGEFVRLSQSGASGEGGVSIHWLPLYGEDAANGAPALIRTGVPPVAED